MYANTTTPDGYVVNENGAMVLDGQVAVQAVQAPETAPAVDSMMDSIGGTYRFTNTARHSITGEIVPPAGVYPEEAIITVVDADTINFKYDKGGVGMSGMDCILKKNGDVFKKWKVAMHGL